MSITKKSYEISLWEDVLVWVGESGKEYFDITKMEEELDYQYYKEIKLCTIGSDSMQSQNRAVNAKFARKINGENTLTFTVYYRYVDNITGEKIENPYVPYLVSERKVKLKYDGEWFDFIIKNIQENSESKAFTYTCKDLFVTELSKTGFEIELDNELENNMGTIEFLADKILEDSDWSIKDNKNPIKQYIEEPLYEITVNGGLLITNIEDETITETLREGENIYVFYSNINDKKPTWQLLYKEDDLFETNDDLVIDKKHINYTCVGFNGDNWPAFISTNSLGDRLVTLSSLRGNRLVKQSKTKYDATIDKYVSVYNDGEIYGFTETEYVTSGGVVNYVANPSNFTSTSGWQTDAKQLDYKLTTNKTAGGLYESYIEVDFTGKQGALVMNAGIGGNRFAIKNFVEGQKYVLRMKYKIGGKTGGYADTAPTVKICEYHMEDSQYVIPETEDDDYNIFTFGNYNGPALTNQQEEKADKSYGYLAEEDKDYVYMEATCARTVSETELKDWDFKVGLFFNFNTTSKVYIEDVQVFPYQTYTEDKIERLCVPGGKAHSEIKTKYIYYKPDNTWQSIADLVPVSEGYAEDPAYELFYETGSQFTKVRSISAKESNRFNLLQDLCETFQAWLKIEVDHNDDGTLKLDEATHRPIKTISFVEEVGEYNPAGFRYGVNSKSIQRTVDSASIVSKMIVKDNANEFAPNGFCSIARATENPTGENFLLNFDYYVRHGLLDGDVVTNDLYLEANGHLGYYTQLKELNANRNEKIDLQAGCLTDIMNYEASYTTYKTSYDSAIEEQLVAERDFCKLLGRDIPHDQFGNSKDHETKPGADGLSEDREDLNKYWVKWCQCENIIKQHGTLYALAKSNLDIKQAEYDRYVDDLKRLKTQKLDLWKDFYKKYSRFIQEGSWIKEDYTDPNLYYIDAESTLYTSTQPKVTYNISVIDVSLLPGYEGYDFKLGDISYIEDPEFFGYSRKPGAAPYREEIVVSEITVELDSPEKNQIKVQNYKTQFEDLFQRITAQTQQAEYHTGEYARAASIVETNGTISASTLENSFANNSFKLSNARDQSVVWDSSGITTTSLSNPSEMVRIISGGVFLSTDGGQSWKTGITGSGINTSYLTAGQINTNEIYIMNGNNAAFRWDEKGLAAYWAIKNDNNETTSYSSNQFIRFDHYGLYGVLDDPDSSKTYDTLDDIHKNAPFALTWRGFSLKNNDGSVKITSSDDIEVVGNSEVTRLKIGRLGTYTDDLGIEQTVYGIRISDQAGNAVMESDSRGELWLKKALIVSTTGYIPQELDENASFSEGEEYYEYEEGRGYFKTEDVQPNSGKIYYLKSASGNITIGEEGNTVINAADKFVVYGDGTVSATDGTFKGRIEANEGTIGNLLLKDGSLYATNGFEIKIGDPMGKPQDALKFLNNGLIVSGIINAQNGGNIGGFIIQDGKLVSENGNITLDGAEGDIIANTIQLGTGAKITDYLQLGDAYIQNPVDPSQAGDNNRPFIQAGDGALEIYQNALIKAGDITINGTESKISGNRFSITPEVANFTNIVASGSIETAVFKQGSIQAAGGAMVFSPSYKIEAIEEGSSSCKLTLDSKYMGAVNDVVWLAAQDEAHRKEAQVTSISDECITLSITDSDISKYLYGSLIQIGQPMGERKPLVMGINSGETIVWDHIRKRGLTIDEYGNKNLPKLFLGDLDAVGLSGYGLYSDNVYLNGSLTTKTSTDGYAGVNTLSDVSGNSDVIGTTGKIIFWAGSQGTTASAIQDAPFQVTEDGYVYLRNSLIAGGELRAAKIRGWADGKESALTIYDTAKGISFKTDNENGSETELFTIGASGLKTEDGYFIKIEGDQALLKTKGEENYVALQEYDDRPALFHHHSNSQWCGLFFDNNETSFKFNVGGIDSTAATFSNNSVKFKQNVEISSGSYRMQYEAISNGYDLFIVSEKEE